MVPGNLWGIHALYWNLYLWEFVEYLAIIRFIPLLLPQSNKTTYTLYIYICIHIIYIWYFILTFILIFFPISKTPKTSSKLRKQRGGTSKSTSGKTSEIQILGVPKPWESYHSSLAWNHSLEAQLSPENGGKFFLEVGSCLGAGCIDLSSGYCFITLEFSKKLDPQILFPTFFGKNDD